MRILTVRQPWAWAIIHGGKDVENRVRNIAGDYRGSVAIHQALRAADEAWTRSLPLHAAFTTAAPEVRALGGQRFNGRIIGVVDLTDVHHATNCPGRTVVVDVGPNLVKGYHAVTCSEWAETGATRHLVLANPRPLRTPIPYRGALGLRTLDADTESRIMADLEEGAGK